MVPPHHRCDLLHLFERAFGLGQFQQIFDIAVDLFRPHPFRRVDSGEIDLALAPDVPHRAHLVQMLGDKVALRVPEHQVLEVDVVDHLEDILPEEDRCPGWRSKLSDGTHVRPARLAARTGCPGEWPA